MKDIYCILRIRFYNHQIRQHSGNICDPHSGGKDPIPAIMTDVLIPFCSPSTEKYQNHTLKYAINILPDTTFIIIPGHLYRCIIQNDPTTYIQTHHSKYPLNMISNFGHVLNAIVCLLGNLPGDYPKDTIRQPLNIFPYPLYPTSSC